MLTDKEKQKIEEEEEYRAQIKKNLKKTSESTKNSKLFIFVFIISIIGGFIYLNASHSTLGSKKIDPDIRFEDYRLKIINQDKFDYKDCKITINDKYNYPGADNVIPSISMHETYELNSYKFTLADGTRFDPLKVDPQKIAIQCDGASGSWNLR